MKIIAYNEIGIALLRRIDILEWLIDIKLTEEGKKHKIYLGQLGNSLLLKHFHKKNLSIMFLF